jgi:hypothetical protein
MLRAELSSEGVTDVTVLRGTDTEASLARVTFVSEQCVVDAASVTLHVDDAVTRKHVERFVDLGDVRGSVRTRALALAVAELLRASWAELELPEVPSAAVEVPSELRRAVHTRMTAPANASNLTANSQTEGVSNSGVSVPQLAPVVAPPTIRPTVGTAAWWLGVGLYGVNERPGRAGARVTLDRVTLQSRVWSWWARAELGADLGGVDDPLGAVLTGTVNAGVAAGLSSSPRAIVSVFTGIRALGGVAWGQGISMQLDVRTQGGVGPYVAVGALGGLRARVAPAVSATVELDAQMVIVSTAVIAHSGASREERVLTGSPGLGLGACFGLAWQL